jgi:ABC-type polysaccharide/polyol phosphate export permease
VDVPLSSSVREFFDAVLSIRIWWAISLDDVIGRYRRTLLGPAWMILSQVMWIGGIYLLHSRFMGGETLNYLSFLASGLAVWSLISALTTEATGSLLRAKSYIDGYPLPMMIHLFRSVTGSFITFFHLILVFVGAFIFERNLPTLTMFAAIPGLMLVSLYGIGIQLLLSPIGARFRDVAPAVSSLINLMFILTPIFWVPTEFQQTNPLILFNPFYYLIEVVRAPLLGSWGGGAIWLGALSVSLGTFVVGLLTYARMRPTVIYWL